MHVRNKNITVCLMELCYNFNISKNLNREFLKINKTGIVNNLLTISVKILFAVIIALLLYKAYFIAEEKRCYDKETLNDPLFNIKVIDFPVKDGWRSYGKVIVNEQSIPNFETFFIAAVYPDEQAEIKLFSTQFETAVQKLEEFPVNEEIPSEINSVSVNNNQAADYMFSVLKKMNPKAENIKLIKNYTKPSQKNSRKYLNKKQFLISAYSDINPATQKSKSELKNVIAEPVSLLFSFYENGYRYYQRIDCDYTGFVQVFEETMSSKKIRQKIKYTKCENVYSYRVLAKYYGKNLRTYEVFKKYAIPDKTWLETVNEARRKIIHASGYSTTQTIMSGDKFNPELLKNLIYTIEYMDTNDREYLTEDLNLQNTY